MEKINEVTTVEQWNEIWEQSMNTPVFVLKHSTSCMISARAFKQVKLLDGGTEAAYYMVKVIENRTVSNQIAKDTSIPHKSPQIFLIDKKQVLWNTSHWKITKSNMEEAVGKLLK